VNKVEKKSFFGFLAIAFVLHLYLVISLIGG
jgi:hypothetical protein